MVMLMMLMVVMAEIIRVLKLKLQSKSAENLRMVNTILFLFINKII